MVPVTLSSIAAVAALTVTFARGQDTRSTFPATPLASKHFPSPTDLPYQVDTDSNLIRGAQFGFNICNSTTQNQQSDCQTAYFNSIEDFCLWAPPKANSTVGDAEGLMVAWCTKSGHGTRLIPAGALQGVQWIRTPGYVEVTGFIDQSLIDMQPSDYGGELDPHGADLRGNPLGGVLYSTAFGQKLTQVVQWHTFMGGSAFCMKACDPGNAGAGAFCQNIFDRIGCAYNIPNNAQNGTFESCLGDNQDVPGVYTDSSGAVKTFTQPPESLGPITSIPYTPRVPPSSSCTTYTSASLYTDLASVIPSGLSSSVTSTGSSAPTMSGSSSRSGSLAQPSATGSSSGAATLAVSGISILGVVFAAVFLS